MRSAKASVLFVRELKANGHLTQFAPATLSSFFGGQPRGLLRARDVTFGGAASAVSDVLAFSVPGYLISQTSNYLKESTQNYQRSLSIKIVS